MVDQDRRVIAWNRAMEEMSGIPKNEMIGRGNYEYALPFYGKRIPILIDVFWEDVERLSSGYTNFERRNHVCQAERRLEHMRHGRDIHVWAITSPLLDRQGRLRGAIESIRDISAWKRTEAELETHRNFLERVVESRTAELRDANAALRKSLENLEQAQNQLIQSEKLAALGGLVAGVAHEINTPLGIAVTAASFVGDLTSDIRTRYAGGSMTRSGFEKYLEQVAEASSSLMANLNRAANLVKNFKQVAVDQSSGERRRFRLRAYIDDLLMSLRPRLKGTEHLVEVRCPDDIELDSYPGAFSQVITNLLVNSLIHGFGDRDGGRIEIEVESSGNEVVIRFRDNGRGIAPEHLGRVFDPFFTTRLDEGTGLGLHIVFNIVTRTLGGRVCCESVPGQGATFTMTIPMSSPASPCRDHAGGTAVAPEGGVSHSVERRNS